jgi:hypothetical protein
VEADSGAVDVLQSIQGTIGWFGTQRAGEQVLYGDNSAWAYRVTHGPQDGTGIGKVAEHEPGEGEVECRVLGGGGGVGAPELGGTAPVIGRPASDLEGLGVRVDAQDASGWSRHLGQVERHLSGATADVEAGPTGLKTGAGQERGGGRPHDLGLALEPVGIGRAAPDRVAGTSCLQTSVVGRHLGCQLL